MRYPAWGSTAAGTKPSAASLSLKAAASSSFSAGASHTRWFLVNMANPVAPTALALSGASETDPAIDT